MNIPCNHSLNFETLESVASLELKDLAARDAWAATVDPATVDRELLACERDEDLEILCTVCHHTANRDLVEDDAMHDRFHEWIEQKEFCD